MPTHRAGKQPSHKEPGNHIPPKTTDAQDKDGPL